MWLHLKSAMASFASPTFATLWPCVWPWADPPWRWTHPESAPGLWRPRKAPEPYGLEPATGMLVGLAACGLDKCVLRMFCFLAVHGKHVKMNMWVGWTWWTIGRCPLSCSPPLKESYGRIAVYKSKEAASRKSVAISNEAKCASTGWSGSLAMLKKNESMSEKHMTLDIGQNKTRILKNLLLLDAHVVSLFQHRSHNYFQHRTYEIFCTLSSYHEMAGLGPNLSFAKVLLPRDNLQMA